MKKLILFFCLALVLNVHAQRDKTEAYINTYKEVAITEMLRTGVPASITLAQGILESQYGESDLVKSSNNHFGIKCKTEWTGPKIYHDDDEKGECFRVYATAEESYRDHSDFLKTRPHYAFLFQLDATDFEGWAKGLKKAGYATNPAYPQKLLKVINDYDLQQYSLLALARLKNESPAITADHTVETVTVAATDTEAASAAVNQGMNVIAGPAASARQEKKTVNYPQGIFSINHTKVIYGTGGTSLLSLANLYEIPLSKLLEYNDLSEMDVLDTDRLVFIEKKQKRGAGDIHVVTSGETLHAISQLEGVRLDNILEYNNFKKGTIATAGDKIYLRSMATAASTKTTRSPKS